ncbi:TOMM propeptide domain-containing protein [Lewinella sp. LCG006]|uniref:TOMM propeptide domain-containing protein n=1 Tax=Lewinella sp. LCG006 TaxID=3231911 RepID=UPI00346047B1
MDFKNSQEGYGRILKEAWGNADFKQRLVANPVATIEAFTGKEFNLPEGKTLVVRDQTDESTVYINIPPDTSEMELTDEQLELVAGGDSEDNGLNPFKWIGYGIHWVVDQFD